MKLLALSFALLACVSRIVASVDVACLNGVTQQLKHAILMAPDDAVVPDEYKQHFIDAVTECGESIDSEEFDALVEEFETAKHLQEGHGDRRLSCYGSGYQCSGWLDCAWGCCGNYIAKFNYNGTKTYYYCQCYAKGTAPVYTFSSTCNSACCIKCHYVFSFFGQTGYVC